MGPPTPPGTSREITGAVYDASNVLQPDSQRIAPPGTQYNALDPERVDRQDARYLPGTWLYGGTWFDHFGHFMLETVTSLWPELSHEVRAQWEQGLGGIVFHRFPFQNPPSAGPYQQTLIDLAGFPGVNLEVVDAQPVAVRRLILPQRSLAIYDWATPEAASVWSRIGLAAGSSSARPNGLLYLSRTRFNERIRAQGGQARTTVARDRQLDELMDGAGFEVVCPETLDITTQIRLATASRVIAGLSGTALHLSAFAPTAAVLQFGDERWPNSLGFGQQLVSAAHGQRVALIPPTLGSLAVRLAVRRLVRRR